MLLKTGIYAGGGGLGRAGDPLGVGATWRKFQPSGVWASFPDVGMWGDMFLLFLELGQKGDPPHGGISFPPEASSFHVLSPSKCRGPILCVSSMAENSPVRSVQ